MIGHEAGLLLDWFRIYFQAYEHEFVDADALESLIRLRSGYGKDDMALVMHMVQQLRKPVDTQTIRGVVNQLYELDFAGRAGALMQQYRDGGEVDLAYEVARLANDTMRSVSQTSPASWIEDNVEDIIREEAEDSGLKFPGIALSTHIKGVKGGASIALGGRPDKGKTSMLAWVLTHFAGQVEEFFDADRPILWLNNEGKGRRIIPRLYQAALGMTTAEIQELSSQGKLRAAYEKKVGRADRIRIKDMHGASLAKIEQVIETMKPCVVAFDMLANFRTSATGSNKADEVEAKWQEVREMAVRHDFVALPTVQVSMEGDNMLYPPYSALKDSKTGIQGATDIILMMGALNDPSMQALRGFSTAKNKYQMPGKPSHVQAEFVFDAERCTFSDGQGKL